ncbi:hypothetical protein O7634_31130 [Micromonospora sp. WMMD1120]|uniref:hypothetical protein n=1 Tax=Micromonospora sp. WMMD1120 TaxID=3016106 RepID=UPI002415E470|nr:hypothetical protein [Micromonospora sp. WMMD1120]MDG4811229.1 hypothetical protein [Micromonospora sp. WMMD1120]
MSLWESVTRIGAPLLMVAGSLVVLFGVFSAPPEKFSRPRGWQWAWMGLWLMLVGEAAFGDDRQWFERAWKGAVALLVAVAVVVAAVRRHRWRAGRGDGQQPGSGLRGPTAS